MNDEIFVHVDLSGSCPEKVCPTCASNGIEHGPSGVRFAHCQHRNAGAWCGLRGWATAQNVSAGDFKRAMIAAVMAVDIAQLEVVQGHSRH